MSFPTIYVLMKDGLPERVSESTTADVAAQAWQGWGLRGEVWAARISPGVAFEVKELVNQGKGAQALKSLRLFSSSLLKVGDV